MRLKLLPQNNKIEKVKRSRQCNLTYCSQKTQTVLCYNHGRFFYKESMGRRGEWIRNVFLGSFPVE
ncbi:MAG: hypothetical protein ACI8RD_001526 [Bacillariaceae sp.]|jgi:hypothetical protein